MHFKFKRHQKVRVLNSPNKEYIEYSPSIDEANQPPIKKGTIGTINMILSNGQYHVELFNEKNELIAYALFSEEELEEA